MEHRRLLLMRVVGSGGRLLGKVYYSSWAYGRLRQQLRARAADVQAARLRDFDRFGIRVQELEFRIAGFCLLGSIG